MAIGFRVGPFRATRYGVTVGGGIGPVSAGKTIARFERGNRRRRATPSTPDPIVNPAYGPRPEYLSASEWTAAMAGTRVGVTYETPLFRTHAVSGAPAPTPAPAPAVDRGDLAIGAVFLAVVLGIPAAILAGVVIHAAAATFGGAAMLAVVAILAGVVLAVLAGAAVRRGWQAMQ